MGHLNLLIHLLIQINLHELDDGFTFHCPFPSQWNFRAKEFCISFDGYHCLYDTNKVQNIEACRDGPQFEAPGYKLQIVGSLEVVECTNDRYQPFLFWTNGSHLCKFEKSFCTDEGQVLFLQGSSKEDSTCRCDYTKGYDFVTRPRKTCFCIPTEEDCSCFIRRCPSGLVLSPDYQCVPVTKVLATSQCPITIRSVETTKRPTLSLDEQDTKYDNYNEQELSMFRIYNVVVSVMVLLVTGVGILYLYLRGKYTIELESLKDLLSKFHPTQASQNIFIAIKENPCVLITGPFGSGKTTIAYNISLKLGKEGYETIFVSDPTIILKRGNRSKRQLFIYDDVFGKYSSNISDITDRWEEHGSSINSILATSDTVKLLITSRTYIYQLNSKCFENFQKHTSFVHRDLISKDLRLDLNERRKLYASYFESDPPESLCVDILSLYHFYPLLCSTYRKDDILKHFKHPYQIISKELSCMQTHFDNSYLALAILVIFHNRVDNAMFSCMNNSKEKYKIILQDIYKESNFKHYPSTQTLTTTFQSLKEEYIKDKGTFLTFISPELFDIVTLCIGGSFMQSILTHSSSVFIKEKLQLSTTQGNDCSHALIVPHDLKDQFYRRLITDMNKNSIIDVLSNKLFESHENRATFVNFLEKHVKSKMLVDSLTGSNVLHIVSSLGYLDFLKHFLKFDKCPGINKKNYKGETPLHLACQNRHFKCVQLLKENKAVVNEIDIKSRTALHFGCEAGNLDIVQYLIRNDAVINIKDKQGLTPLHTACDKGHYSVVKFLVGAKAKINEQDKNGKTPMHYACEQNLEEIVRYLVSQKAHVNKCDNQDFSPLHYACKCGNIVIVALLVNNKASVSIKNKEGQTPADIAIERGRVDITEFLVKYI